MRHTIALSLLLFVVFAISLSVGIYKTTAPLSGEQPNATFGGVSLRLEFATTSASRARGLGGRALLGKNSGMLFVFLKDDRYGFWMKDTLIPLDIFWLNNKGQVVTIVADVMPSSYPNVFYPSAPARYVLETNAGFAREHGITIGTLLRLQNIERVSE